AVALLRDRPGELGCEEGGGAGHEWRMARPGSPVNAGYQGTQGGRRSRLRRLSLQQPGLRKAQVSVPPDDHVVVDRHIEEAPRIHELPRHRPVVRAGGWVTARMVMHDDDPRRRLADRRANHLPWMHSRAVLDPASD